MTRTLFRLTSAFLFLAAPIASGASAGDLPAPIETAALQHTQIVERAPLAKFAGALSTHRNRLVSSESDRAMWSRQMRPFARLQPLEKIRAVHRYFNALTYGNDSRADDWSAPVAFMRRGTGDCEDYATAKYEALRALGIPAHEMSVVVFIDPRLRAAHAVLLVRHGGSTYVLDNRYPDLATTDTKRFGRVLYAVNEKKTELFVTRLARSGAVSPRS
ncbi:MAG: transglutaminase-like cysteine peptidase [Alphaproteobacteria bacterium]|nr:transglutaminase-like cysteine peptidase [Alphaproteobacteria bacterium]